MIVVTKESLVRGNFSLSTPIKYSYGMLHPRNKPRVDWLAQRGGCCHRRGTGSIPRGLKIFVAWVFHGTAWLCAGLSLDLRFLPFALTFSVWRSLDVLPLLVFAIFARWMFSCSLFRWKFLVPLLVFGLDDDWVSIFIRPAGLQHKQNTRTNGLRSKRACTGPQRASTGGHR